MPDHRLGIAMDNMGWWVKLEEYARAADVVCEVFEIERSDWLDRVQSFTHIVWRPNLDPPFCEEAKEKIYYIERILGKRIFPNWATFWHYDNKRAQAYFFATHKIPSPKTFVSYSREEACDVGSNTPLPLVSKNAGGAGSQGVRLLSNRRQVASETRRVFDKPILLKVLDALGIHLRFGTRALNRYVLWQQYMPNNKRDLRITVLGKDHIFAFWRNNRKGDFRASGSGLIDYDVEDVEAECRYCAELCRTHDFDTMAFDIVYGDAGFVIIEMSYAFNDKAIHDAPGHYLFNGADHLTFVRGHVWPQKLMIDYTRRVIAPGS